MQSFKREREMDESTNAWTDEWTDGPNGVFKPPASVENEVLPLIHSTTRMSVSSDALVSKSRREWRPARVCSPTWSIMLLAVGMAPSTRNTSQNAGLEGTAAGPSSIPHYLFTTERYHAASVGATRLLVRHNINRSLRWWAIRLTPVDRQTSGGKPRPAAVTNKHARDMPASLVNGKRSGQSL